MERLSNEHKQRVCAAFASIIRFSGANKHINVDRFFLEMSRDFERLFAGGVLDLNPLFISYGGRNPAPEICGAFMKFETTAPHLGIKVRLAEALTRLPLQLRQEYRAQFEDSYRPETVRPPNDHLEWLKSPLTPPPIEIHGHDLDLDKRHPRAFSVSEATRIAIADAAAWAIKDSPGGHKISGGQIVYLLRDHFDRFCDGHHLDIGPLLTLWRKQLDLDVREIREGLQRLKHYLGEIGISLDDPLLGLDPSSRRLIHAALDTKPDLFKLYPPPSDARKQQPSDRPRRTTSGSVASATPEDIDEDTLHELAQYGLDGQADKKPLPNALWLLPVLLVFMLTFILMRPVRDLNVRPYDQLLPLKSAQIVDQTFYGVMDVKRWKTMTKQQRLKAAEALSKRLKAEGRLIGASISRPGGRLAIFHLKGHGLKVSAEVLSLQGPTKASEVQ